MEMVESVILNQFTGLPDWVTWAFLAAAGLLFAGFYIFPKQIRSFTDKYNIPFDGVDAAVRRIAMLAVRLYVVKRGIDDTRKIEKMQTIALVIDSVYPSKGTSLRVSELVNTLSLEMARKYGGRLLDEHIELVNDISETIVNEVSKVGSKVNDNENDPLINTKDVSDWIKKGTKSVSKLI